MMSKQNVLYAVVASFFLLASCASKVDTAGEPDVIAMVDPFQVATLGMGLSDLLGLGMNQTTFDLFFAPRGNATIMAFSYQMNKTEMFLDYTARQTVIAAVGTYLEEYEAKTLRTKGKTTAEYGKMQGYMEWGVLTKNARATPEISIGYDFVKDSPYFTLTVPESTNLIFEGVGGSRVQRSAYMRFYFNREQAVEFAQHLSQEFLLEALGEQDVPEASFTPDSY
ncbi:MAG: hypothetical protein JW875_05830 [Spirochaetales bacterium]|nr:hypothetical protein [Spirochaetales bacterium]